MLQSYIWICSYKTSQQNTKEENIILFCYSGSRFKHEYISVKNGIIVKRGKIEGLHILTSPWQPMIQSGSGGSSRKVREDKGNQGFFFPGSNQVNYAML